MQKTGGTSYILLFPVVVKDPALISSTINSTFKVLSPTAGIQLQTAIQTLSAFL